MTRRKFQIGLILISICFPHFLFAQSADEIIQKHIKAHGGAKKWDQIEAMKISGNFTAFSIEKEFTTYKTKDGGYYGDLYLGEKKVIEAFDGKNGWTIDPWQEIFYARSLNAAENNVMMQKAEFFTPFYKYKERGYEVEYLGKKQVDGTDVFAIKLTRNNGKIETWYLDAKTYLEYKCESQWVDFASVAPSETFFDDFRKVNGLVIPFYVERIFWQRDRISQIENIEFNPDFDENIMVMPKREEIRKLQFMEGEWDVTVETMGRRGSWYKSGQTTSSISFASTNMLQENISYEETFPINKTVSYTYNSSTKRYRISAFNDFSSTVDLYEGIFKDNILVFDDVTIRYGVEGEETRPSTQYQFSDIGDNGFTLVHNITRDGGQSWNPRIKFIYTRKQ